MKNILYLGLLAIMPIVVHAQCITRYADCYHGLESGYSVDGAVKGQIKETKNAIYIRNIEINQKNSNNPALSVIANAHDKKRVIIENVEVNIHNASVYNNQGLAGSVALHFENEGNTIDGLKINAMGYNRYVAKTDSQQNGAGIGVIQYVNNATKNIVHKDVEISNYGLVVSESIQNIP